MIASKFAFLTPGAYFGGADEDEAAINNRGMGGAAAKSEPEEVVVTKSEDESHKKEKSVLQAKLTKLAIQIGYAGMTSDFLYPSTSGFSNLRASEFQVLQ